MPMNLGTDPLIADQLRRVILKIDESGNGNLDDGGITSEGLVSWEGDRLKFEVVAKLGINIAKQPSGEPRWLYFKPEGSALVYDETTRLEKVL